MSCLQAALKAGMRCVITYTKSSSSQDFAGAELVVSNLDADSHPVNIKGLLHSQEVFDDRKQSSKAVA